jgi:YidC/Oxa1 family membrane protein insertase
LYNIFLTQNNGFILGPIASILGWILNTIYEFLSLFGIANVGIVIILFTFIVKGLMTPLTIKQQKFSKLSAKMNPEITKINNKYKGKKDQESMQKQQLETQAVYEKYGASPTAGCLPLLITLPIMFALYRVIVNIPAYVNDIYALYASVAEGIVGTNGYVTIMQDFAETAKVSTTSFEEITASGSISINHVIDILSKFTSEQWSQLAQQFPSLQLLIADKSKEIMNVNSFLGGLNILDTPSYRLPGILIPILAAGLQWVSTKQITSKNPMDKENPMAASMNSMNNIMPIMSGVFTFMLPIGVGLYWVAGSVFTIIQQFILNKHMEKVDIDELIKKNVEKASKKKAKKGSASVSLEELAKKQTRSIESKTVEVKSNSTSDYANSVKKNYNNSTSGNDNVSYKSGSISANANLLKNRNNDKGDK